MKIVVKGGLNQLLQLWSSYKGHEVASPRTMAHTNPSAGVIYLYCR
jgi:hypothetical protein